ncbi:chemotaxis protein CheB [Tunicatimonas pelagia]|uniref:chemotaxis protein CheB n=1 Tax=Tunicatimonas pelagia TaxID=931531 RepID=UPI0026654DB2|nr:chemotaxis protein CheB [Tunicatimonas pelagia]WKN43863.1 chemotaxis protein CheB [Tunicatimonas pelagia]
MSDQNDFFIVGIGASAGGLQALQAFFSELPDQNPAAFIVIQHLSPDFESMMDELLAKYTKMSIVKVTKSVIVKPNHVYVMSPKQNLELVNGSLKPKAPNAYEKPNLPIDLFFNSLGKEWKSNAVGIIMTGTGTDGSRGIKTIKEQGGIVMAQHPDSAKFDGMPNAAVHTGLTDFILDLPELAKETQRVINRIPQFADSGDPLTLTDRGLLDRILSLIAKKIQIDFSEYKEATILRRIQKRMHIVNVDILEDYYNVLLSNRAEVEQLGNEILIGVSSFFRDGRPWKVFREKVLPELGNKIQEGDSLRIWIAGCSSGEEAYTIGMLIDDYLTKNQLKPDYKIFGSDIDKRAIQMASAGIYGLSVADSIPKEYLSYYFTRSGDTYRVKKFFRDHFVFAAHNIITDPPFIRMDVVSCRNVLIYLNSDVQKKVMSHFHFSLNQDGFLILGKSESIGHLQPFFGTPAKGINIFQNQVPSAGKQLSTEPRQPFTNVGGQYSRLSGPPRTLNTNTLKALIAESYDEAGVLVNKDCYILHTLGSVNRYFHFPKNNLRMHLEDVLETDEYLLLKSGVRETLSSKKSVYHPDVLFVKGQSKNIINLRFKAIQSPFFEEEVVYIEFQNARKPDKGQKKQIIPTGDGKQRIALLEKEVDEKQRLLQALREELDTHSEELQTTNEELLASNEELQSSNEELQSVNEELYSLNAELEDKIKEVTEANSDVLNLINSTQIATIFIDQDLHIRRLTSNVAKVVNVSARDIGRSIKHFTTNLDKVSLTNLIKQTIKAEEALEQEVSSGERSYLMRMLPYYEANGDANGLVITFVDITEIKNAQLAVDNVRSFAENIVNTVTDPLLVLDQELKIVSVNPAFYDTFQLSEEHTIGYSIFDLDEGQWKQPDLQRLLQEIIHQSSMVSDYQIEHDFPRIGQRIMDISAVVIPQTGSTPNLILLSVRDITEKERNRQQLKEIAERLNLVRQSSDIGTWEYNIQTKAVVGDARLRELFDIPDGDLKFENFTSRIHPEDQARVVIALEQAVANRTLYTSEFRVVHSNGDIRHLIGQGSLIDDEEGNPYKVLGINLDITKQRQAEEDKAQYGKLLEESYNEIYIFDANSLRFINVNQGARHNLGYSMEEMQALTPLEIETDFTFDHFSNLIEPLRTGEEEAVAFEAVHQRKNGSKYDVLVNLQLSDFHGQKVFIAIIQDTSEQVESRELLRQSEERLAFAISGTSDGIWDWTDLTTEDGWWSPRFYEIIGYKAGEIESSVKGFRAISHPDDIDIWENKLEEHFKNGTAYDVTVRLKHKTKGYRWFRSRGKAIYDSEDKPVRMSGVISDVHDQKTAEKKLKRTNQELRVANEYLDNFVFAAAHDLRAPVANLKSLSSLLESKNGQDKRVVNKIDQSVNRLEETLRGIIRILDVQQLGNEEYSLLQFADVLKQVSGEIKEEIDQYDATIEHSFAVETIQYVEFYLVSIVKNLLTNAIKSSVEGRPPRISFKTKERDQYICLEVQDNGKGLDMKRDGKHLFQPFKRINSSVDEVGVSLHIVKAIVEKNGGKIEVQSQPDNGTTFSIHLMPYTHDEKNIAH